MDPVLKEYFKGQHCATICCSQPNQHPYCFSCFYVFDALHQRLIFKSSGNTYHEQLMKEFPNVAGSVLPDTLSKLRIRGLQFEGQVHDTADKAVMKEAYSCYHTSNPAALAFPGAIWVIDLLKVKFTDNKLGFGKKISWCREAKPIRS